jgi:predicted dithiol-disulfide oxidoreductase (DUF899 family)
MKTECEQEIVEQINALKEKLVQVRRANASGTVSNYRFQTPRGEVSLADLFGHQADLLMIHNMGVSCDYCTAYADGINGVLAHLQKRTAVALVSNDDPNMQLSLAKSRNWNFNIVSAAGTTFSNDLGFESEPGDFWPGVIGFRKHGDQVACVSKTFFDPGDDLCVIWPLFTFLEGGVGDWKPQAETTRAHA